MTEEQTKMTWLDTPDPQKFINNAAKFNDLMMMYRCAIREVQTKLEVLDDEFSVEYKRNPISFIKTRIKKPESIYRKLQKLGYDFTAENIQEYLNDVAGVRVVCAFIDDIYTVANLIAGQDDIIEYIHKNWVDEVFFAVPKAIDIPEQIVRDCSAMGVVIHMQLATMKSLGKNQIVEELAGYPVLSSSIRIVTPRQMFVKRAMDIAGGLVGCLFTGIAAIFLVPAIKIKSPGPAFFSQVRMGKNGCPFKIYKFRSMYMDAEERKKELMKQNNVKDGMMFKMDDDPRIIKGVGHFIRKTSLDEFPQFWNILKGDMSLVGTRPPTMDEWEKYELHHRKRLAIKPGLTGMWQVSGRSDITDFEEVVELDTRYISDWSLKLDVEILFKTVMVVFRGSGAK